MQGGAAGDDAVPVEFHGISSINALLEYGLRFEMDTPLAHDLVMNTSNPIDGQLEFTSDLAFPATVSVTISATNSGRLLAHGTVTGTIQSGTPIHVNFLPLADAERILAEEGPIDVDVEITTASAGPGAASLGPNFNLVPKSSYLAFPFIKDPQASQASISLGPALLTLSERTQSPGYVNPGRGKLFNATVLNEGIEIDDAHLEVLYDQAKWQVQILPGASYKLPPGEAAKFSILAKAPKDAKEGELLNILVNATSGKDPKAVAQLRFTAVVTSNVDIPDESSWFQIDADTEAKVAQPPKGGSPGFEAILVAAALVGALGFRRGRRT
jgi:hypothetical protein